MRAAVINFHFACNFGAVLECYALQTTLERIGVEVVIIDYRPDYMEQQFAEYPNPIKFAKWAAGDYRDYSAIYRLYRISRRVLQCCYRYLSINKRKKRKKGFEPFLQNLNLSSITYKTIEDLRISPPACDAYISGSDQIWNPVVTGGGLDRAYFLDFGGSDIVRIGYAVSPCQLDVARYYNDLKRLLSNYNYISLRETEKLEDLSKIIGKDISICADPTLLLARSDYEKMEIKPEHICADYILVYGFYDKNSNLLKDICRFIESQFNILVYDISTDELRIGKNVYKIRCCRPEEFIYYINHAKLVITNSFHATVFSLIFHKEFICIEKQYTNSRLRELLDKSGLEYRLVTCYEENRLLKVIESEAHFEKFEDYLEDVRKLSISFLKNSMAN